MGLISRVSSRTYRQNLIMKASDTIKQEADVDFTEDKGKPLASIQGELNVLKTADGSALITDYSCKTQVLVAVHGPCDVRETRQIHDRMTITVSFLKEQQPMYEVETLLTEKENTTSLADAFIQTDTVDTAQVTTNLPLNLQQNSIEQDIKSMLYETLVLSHFKRAELQITIQVLQNCGNIRANTLNAVILALLDSGIPMKTTPLALEYEEPSTEDGDDAVTTSYLFLYDRSDGYQSVIQSSINGAFTLESYKRAQENAKQELDKYRALHLSALREKFSDLM